MKTTIKYLAGIAFSLFMLTSCQKDVLDKKDFSRTSEATVWNDISLVDNYINYFYATIPSAFSSSGSPLNYDVATDIGDNGLANDVLSTERYANAAQANWGAADKVAFYATWTALYQNIRRANDFLNRIDAVSGDENLKKRMKTEVRFFRAMYYFQLTNIFSDDAVANQEPLGVPIIEKAMVYGADSISVPRNTKKECVDYVVSELNQAAKDLGELPASYTSQVGRITKGAALALKGRMLLYAGRYQEAAAVCKEVMGMGYTLYPDYGKLFTVKNNSEVILSVQHNNVLAERGHQIDFFLSPGSQGGYARWNPTQNLVDSYELTDGKLPAESPLYDAQNPYVNRDKRFYATVVYDGSTYRGKVMQLYTGGFDIVNGGVFKSQTNYYLRKFANESYTDMTNTLTGSDQNWIVIRLGEVLLNYAEAQNEAVGPDATVYNAINQLRTRAGLPNLPAGLSQAEMRDRIRRERKVELAFEDFRFWDVRRWRIADQPGQLTINGMTVTLNATTGVKTYTPKVVETRPFPQKFYTTPIPIEEMNNNKKMVQNTFWK